jgi:sodium transport system permease protein
MSLRNVGIVYRKELTDSLRDRRTLISMILVPLLLFPVLMVGLSYIAGEVIGEARRQPSRVMVLGGEDSPGVLAALRQAPGLNVLPGRPDYVDQISEKRIRAAVEIPPGFEAALEQGNQTAVKIYMYEGDLKSQTGVERLQKFFRDLSDRTLRKHFAARHLPEGLLKPINIAQKNVASPEKVWGTLFGGMISYMVILLSMTGAMYPAMDLAAGEKERGTIETILCSPVSRVHLVLGKFLMVMTASLATVALSAISLGGSFYGLGKLAVMQADKGPSLQMAISLKSIAAVLMLVLPLAVFFSSALLAISLFAKSYREAQSYLTPLTFVVIIPAVVAMLPGTELNTKLALVPILNTALVSKEIMTGTYHWKYIAMIFASSCVYGAAALFIAVKLFQREEVLFRA